MGYMEPIKDYDKAEVQYHKAVALKHPQARYWMARMLGDKRSKWGEAVSHMNQAAAEGHRRARQS